MHNIAEAVKNRVKIKESIGIGDISNIQEEFGDARFTMINLSLFLQLNAEYSLTNATNKFINRFVDVFALAESKGQNLYELSTEEQELLWREGK